MEKKRNFIELSDSETESSQPESDEEAVVEISSSTSCDDEEEDCDYDNEDYDHDYNDEDNEDTGDEGSDDDGNGWKGSENEEEDDIHDEESVCNKVTQFIRGKSSLKELKLVECRVFLRRHGLRLSGTKEECVERINEFWRLKDGNGEGFYPRSSFTVDCTGDVCRGDVVLFSQKVYQTFDKMKRHGNVLGRRTVAGRIVKESYGAAKQQHTFTVEVLWSRGTNKLAPLSPLLVKGRNLYKLKTFRQVWKNERERSKVLAEKHQRGAAARTVRAMRKTKMATVTNKLGTCKNGAKRRKHFDHLDSSRTKEKNHRKKNRVTEHGKASTLKNKRSRRQNFTSFQASSSKQNRDFRDPAPAYRRHENPIQENQFREPPYLPYNYSSEPVYHFQPGIRKRELNHFHSNSDSHSTLPYFHQYQDYVLPVSEHQEFSHDRFIHPSYSRSRHENESRNFPRPMHYPSFCPSFTFSWR